MLQIELVLFVVDCVFVLLKGSDLCVYYLDIFKMMQLLFSSLFVYTILDWG